ncbi:hypothetical protein SM124_08235 [Bacillus sp. 31A1R]|uniref:DUF4901 domain-containing protein n=1 Tax=Robertmurraya mangrovi TaxID=3098077 RepID=A0ABU5IX41_9BACI|nr:hypothetical protein [Bacillus sp. 31A1R]MDZ5471733.1 hypothetical protein [Bacillus sp. 31A1R]
MNIHTFNPEEKIREIKRNFYLDTFHITDWSIRQIISPLKETSYVLNIEFYPPNQTYEKGGDFNPDGTVIIEWEINLNLLKTFIIVGGLDKREIPKNEKDPQIIVNDWLDCWLGVKIEDLKLEFKKESENETEFSYRSVLNHILVYPSGNIVIKVNERGNITFYSIYGLLPSLYFLNFDGGIETFLGDIGKISRERLGRIAMPKMDSKGRLTYELYYGIEETFIDAKGEWSHSYDVLQKDGYQVNVEMTLEWHEKDELLKAKINIQPLDKLFSQFNERVSFHSNHPSQPIHPDLEPIDTELEQNIILLIKSYLKDKGTESGEYILQTLVREQGMILAMILPINSDLKETKKKFIFINPKELEIVQIMEKPLGTESKINVLIHLSEEDALKKLEKHITLSPYYVFIKKEQPLKKMFLIDCPVLVHCQTGEIYE